MLPEDEREAADRVALQVDVARHDHLDDALALLSLPRVSGTDGEEIVAQNGRYGPYVKKGSETRSLESEEQLFTITLEQALELLAQPKERAARRRGRAAARGARPRSRQRKPIVVKEGPLRPLRHRRRDERQPPPRRRRRVADAERALELLADRARRPRPEARPASGAVRR